MRVIKVIESKRWVNLLTGNTASIYGSVPYTSDNDACNWKIVAKGYTWLRSDGTVGLGRMPATTYEEAIEVMNKVNNL